MTKVEWRQRDGMHFLVGRLDAHTGLAQLAAGGERPVRLNFRDATAMTTLGAKALRELVAALPDRGLELHECQPFVVDILNIVPGMTGTAGHRVVVASVYVPYRCEACGVETDCLLKTDAVRTGAAGVSLPPQRCHGCRAAMEPLPDPDDYFMFLGEAKG